MRSGHTWCGKGYLTLDRPACMIRTGRGMCLTQEASRPLEATEMSAIARYRAALAHPGATRVTMAAFACRMLAGMVSLALLLFAEDATGSYAQAGLVSGAYAVALAFTSPLWGRIADRRGPRAALAWSTSLQSVFFAL